MLFFVSIGWSYGQNDWKPVTETQNGIEFSQKKVEWQDISNGVHSEVILVRITNTNDQTAEVSWQDERYYNGKCYACGSEESFHTLTLAPGETREGELVFGKTGNGLRIFVRSMNGRTETQLTDFKIHDIQVALQ